MWIMVKKGEDKCSSTYEITSYNENFNKNSNEYELWVERITGKNVLLISSKNKTDILEVKEAIDFAIAQGIHAFEIEV